MNTGSFYDTWRSIPWQQAKSKIYSASREDVERALAKNTPLGLLDFAALLSPSALQYIELMTKRSHQVTRQRFGNVMQLYIPLYLSNECQNICTYCGFSFTNKIERLTLNEEQILNEVRAIKELGYDHVLLVTGEAPRKVGVEYLCRAVDLIRPHFSQVSIEVQPLEEQDYILLIERGVYAVLVYQETYNTERYKTCHPKGKKSNFRYRLETPDRLGRAGVHKIGLGTLLGLEDWRTDSFFVALHLAYLRKNYWRTRYSISFPRLRPAEGIMDPYVIVNECELAQLICAFRLFDENLELSISTREREKFRDHSMLLGITAMSAGSRTEPGGYAARKQALKQFEVADERSVQEVAAMLRERGYEPVWKDWDKSLDAFS